MKAAAFPWCVVMPAFREAGRIGPVVEAVRSRGASVIVVDDGSPDTTAAEAEEAGATVVRHPVNRGKGSALATGFEVARARGCEVVVTMDADGQHDPADLSAFVEAYERTGIPVLIGNRMADAASMPRVRRWTNTFMSVLLSWIMGKFIPDTQCGYRLYHREILPFAATISTGFAAESEVLLRLSQRGVRMDSVRVRTVYGVEKSKIVPLRDTFRFFRMLARFRRERRRPRYRAFPVR